MSAQNPTAQFRATIVIDLYTQAEALAIVQGRLKSVPLQSDVNALTMIKSVIERKS
jgi:hypothetical protein